MDMPLISNDKLLVIREIQRRQRQLRNTYAPHTDPNHDPENCQDCHVYSDYLTGLEEDIERVLRGKPTLFYKPNYIWMTDQKRGT